ncbi:MAG: hypothetical protein LBR22_10280 [Desulfovibrio sp.]|jgi:hypothetical protein|nr:hypothetical protein [Desulfovibrio sp.]
MTDRERSRLKEYLEGKTHEELLSLFLKSCEEDDRLASRLIKDARLTSNTPDLTVEYLCNKVEEIYKNRDKVCPRFAEFNEELYQLISKGEGDAALKVCDVILKYAYTFVTAENCAQSTCIELEESILMATIAIEASSMSHIDGLIHAIECDSRVPDWLATFDVWLYEMASKEDWSIVADTLIARHALDGAYTKELVTEYPDVACDLDMWVAMALNYAGRVDEARAQGLR